MATVRPRVKVPRSAKAGEVVTIKTLISHPMKSGQRKGKEGNTIPRKIINHFAVTFEGEPVLAANIEPAVSANPYIEFSMKVPGPGTIRFDWTDDDGTVYELEEKIDAA